MSSGQGYEGIWGTSGGIEWACKPGQFTVEMSKPSDLLNPSMWDYSCSNPPAGPLTVEMNGCAFIFHVAELRSELLSLPVCG
jgi:hypothetical protein